jgi:hypothetical protein
MSKVPKFMPNHIDPLILEITTISIKILKLICIVTKRRATSIFWETEIKDHEEI